MNTQPGPLSISSRPADLYVMPSDLFNRLGLRSVHSIRAACLRLGKLRIFRHDCNA